ncbi:DNA binding protein [Arthrobacter phage Sloopyjoe]|nr:DNA binding protein [Arthrobacter phage Stayer]QFG09765.1 DNA binding protein [Arthrobacter phage Shiba]QFG10202.1 DNA binding protein [Arthrobacter phage Egad]QFG12654.1 DNA binding protein [Arthrobacter phage Michelle]QFG14427.1 DNA binding protein [Arthrobacter phage StarLord]WAB09475.1 DNA binding protein [Arthrobacter phage Sloopyjoe]WKW85777.1 DNA binding protein [Arthrobacter phage MrAaronian]WNO27662.1 DNA binding protein [Arthrobacter phage Djungelskog]
MAQKEVIEFTCDNCGAEGEAENIRRLENPLPPYWWRLQLTWNHGHYDYVDICGACYTEINEALLRRRS